MFPYIVFLGRTFTAYQIMALLGILSAGIYSSVSSKNKKIDYTETILFLLLACAGIVLGSRLLYIIVNCKYIGKERPFSDIINLFFSGSVFYGGLIGGIFATYIFRKKFVNYAAIVEIVTPALPLFHFFGRIGCFLNGCCFGVESSIGFKFNSSPIEAANGIIRLPVQLIEATYNVVLFIVLYILKSNKLFKGRLFYCYLMLYSIGRFVLEFFRGDAYRGIYFHISISQIISIALFLVTGIQYSHSFTIFRKTALRVESYSSANIIFFDIKDLT